MITACIGYSGGVQNWFQWREGLESDDVVSAKLEMMPVRMLCKVERVFQASGAALVKQQDVSGGPQL